MAIQDKIIDQTFIDAANAYGKLATNSMRAALAGSKRGYATGALYKSLTFSVLKTRQNNYQIKFNMLPYGRYVHYGTKGNPEYGKGEKKKSTKKTSKLLIALEKWMQIKGIPKNRLWPIFFKIKRKGIKPNPFYKHYNKDLNKMRTFLEENASKAVERVVKTTIDQTKRKK